MVVELQLRITVYSTASRRARQPRNLPNSKSGRPSGSADKFGLSFFIANETSDSEKNYRI